MTLRTLKDFEELDNKDCRLRFNLLRQEAVKHINELCDESEEPSVCKWIKYFFNIKAEDLK